MYLGTEGLSGCMVFRTALGGGTGAGGQAGTECQRQKFRKASSSTKNKDLKESAEIGSGVNPEQKPEVGYKKSRRQEPGGVKSSGCRWLSSGNRKTSPWCTVALCCLPH